MRVLFLVFAFIFSVALAEEENIVSKTDIIPLDVQKRLGIKAEKVKRQTINITKIYMVHIKNKMLTKLGTVL